MQEQHRTQGLFQDGKGPGSEVGARMQSFEQKWKLHMQIYPKRRIYLLLLPAALDWHCISDVFTTFRHFLPFLLRMLGPWQLSWKAPARQQ